MSRRPTAKSTAEYLRAKLESLGYQAGSDRSLPAVILFGPEPSSVVEARLLGLLEGLYFAGRVSGREASEWAARFRSALARAQPNSAFATTSLVLDQRASESQGTIPRPWPPEARIATIKSDLPSVAYKTGQLALKQIDVYPEGILLSWDLKLSSGSKASVREASKKFEHLPRDRFELHAAHTLLPLFSAGHGYFSREGRPSFGGDQVESAAVASNTDVDRLVWASLLHRDCSLTALRGTHIPQWVG
jgi:hypothetical protein